MLISVTSIRHGQIMERNYEQDQNITSRCTDTRSNYHFKVHALSHNEIINMQVRLACTGLSVCHMGNYVIY